MRPMRPEHRPSRGRDVVIAAVVTVITVTATSGMAHEAPGVRPLDWFAYLLLVAGGLVLLVRRFAPVAVLLTTFACVAALGLMGYAGPGPFALPLLVALFTAMSLGRRAPAVAVAVAFLVLFVLNGVLAGGAAREALPFVPGWVVATLVAGEMARSRRDYFAEARRRAVEVERSREEEMRRRATEERLRIAREVHDVLSHSISMINVQAGVAVHLLDSKPEQARTALVAIKQASKDALRDLRATLGVLRDVDGDAGDRGPARGLARMEELVAGAAAAGVELDVRTYGQPAPLPAGVDLAAYRIVQQSVSNVVRHAGRTTGVVELRYEPGTLTIVVDNAPGARHGDAVVGPVGAAAHAEGSGDGVAGMTGAGGADGDTAAGAGGDTAAGAGGDGGPGAGGDGGPGAGNGIRGMRERAEALGGQLRAGPRPDGGFRVVARLPTGEDR